MLLERIRGYLTPRSDAARAEAAERRRARRKSVLLRATIYPIDVFTDAIIRDVSATGVKGEADVELAIGQTLHLTTDEKTYYPSTVKWTLDRQFGLDFPNANEILGQTLPLVDHGTDEGHQPRALRMKVNISARIVGGRPPRPAVVRNVSATGMLLESGPGLRPGQHMVVRIGNSSPIYGRTQWSVDGRIGFKAQSPISVLNLTCAEDE